MCPSRMPLLSSLLLQVRLSKRFRVPKAPTSDSANGPSEFAVAFFWDTVFFLCPSHAIIFSKLLLGSNLTTVAQFFSKLVIHA